MRKNVISAAFISLLAACGGGSSADATRMSPVPSPPTGVQPFSQSGFAKPGDEFNPGANFVLRDVIRLVDDDNGERALVRQDVRISGVSDNGEVIVTLGGRQFTLARNPNSSSQFLYNDGISYVSLQTVVAGNDQAVGLEFYAELDDRLNSGSVIVGFDTDPATIAARSGLVTYTGDIFASLRNRTDATSDPEDGFLRAFGEGSFSLDVSFENGGSVSGSAVLEDSLDDNATFTFDPINIVLDETLITENGFSGQLRVADLPPTNLSESGYEGRFFGSDAEGVGGQFSARIDIDSLDEDTLVEGVFVGNR